MRKITSSSHSLLRSSRLKKIFRLLLLLSLLPLFFHLTQEINPSLSVLLSYFFFFFSLWGFLFFSRGK